MFIAVNRSQVRSFETNHVWVDRRSVLGNPFEMKEKTSQERNRVIAQYRKWLWEQIQSKNAKVINELNRLLYLERQFNKLCLVCWCKPLPCHSDVLVKCLEWWKGQKVTKVLVTSC